MPLELMQPLIPMVALTSIANNLTLIFAAGFWLDFFKA
jgi:hypothetical protein